MSHSSHDEPQLWSTRCFDFQIDEADLHSSVHDEEELVLDEHGWRARAPGSLAEHDASDCEIDEELQVQLQAQLASLPELPSADSKDEQQDDELRQALEDQNASLQKLDDEFITALEAQRLELLVGFTGVSSQASEVRQKFHELVHIH
jgi:hypothetical protein